MEFLEKLENDLIDLVARIRTERNKAPGTPVVVTTPPPPSPTGNPLLDAYANSNPISTASPGGPPPANVNYLEAADYDIRALNGPRRYTNGNNTHFITPDRDGVLFLHSGKMPGNVADSVTLYVFGAGLSESMQLPTTDQVFKFNVKAGVRYGITISSPEVFALEITAELQ